MTISAVSGWSSSNEALNTDLNDIPLGEGITRVPHFNGAIREMMKQIAAFNTAAAFTGATASFTYADSGASQGPVITLDRNSGTPAISDALGFLLFTGRDSGAAAQSYAGIRASIVDPTAASEDGVLELYTATAGTFGVAATLGAGLYMAGSTDPGAGKIAATGMVYPTNAILDFGSGGGAGFVSAFSTTFSYSDNGASQGPEVYLRRVSTTPAASDALGFLIWQGNDSGAGTQNYTGIRSSITDPTAASEDGVMEFYTVTAGTFGVAATLGAGLYMAGATDPGAGKIAATGATFTTGATVSMGDISLIHASSQITARWSDDTGTQGPLFILDRLSTTPAASDALGFLVFRGRDSGGNATNYSGIRTTIIDATDTSEDGVMELLSSVAGTLAARANIAQGLYMTGATGGDKGVGTINATAVYDDNVLLTCYPFDAYLDGKINNAKWDAKVPARHFPAVYEEEDGKRVLKQRARTEQRKHDDMRKFKARLGTDTDPLDLDKYIAHWKAKRHLTSMPNEETFDPEGGLPAGAWIQRLIETVEIQAIHISQLHDRLKVLEAK
jgi:nitrogen fixation protein FixH